MFGCLHMLYFNLQGSFYLCSATRDWNFATSPQYQVFVCAMLCHVWMINCYASEGIEFEACLNLDGCMSALFHVYLFFVDVFVCGWVCESK